MAHAGNKRHLEDEFAAVAHSPSKRPRTLSTPVRPVPTVPATIPVQRRVHKSVPRRFFPYEAHTHAQSTMRRKLDFSAAVSSSDSDPDEDAVPGNAVPDWSATLNVGPCKHAEDSDEDSDEVVIVRPRAKDMRITIDDVFPRKNKTTKKIKREPPAATLNRVLRQDIEELVLSKASVDKLIEDTIEGLLTLRHVVRRLDPESATGSIFGLSAQHSYRTIQHSIGAARTSFIKVHDAMVDFQFKQCARYSLETLDLGGSISLGSFPLKMD